MKRAYAHLELENQQWIDARVAWILREFGHARARQVPVITLDDPLLTELEQASTDDLLKIFARMADSIGLDSSRIDFAIYSDLKDGEGQSAAGLYYELDGRFQIEIDALELEQPQSLASTVVHELCHVHLLGTRRIDADETEDHEPLTDLLGVFMGYGLSFANAALLDQRIDIWSHRFGKHGYMTMAMYGYSMALFAALRQERGRDWLRQMRPDVRDAFVKSQRFLDQHGMPDLSIVPERFPMPILQAPESQRDGLQGAALSRGFYPEAVETPQAPTDYPVDATQVPERELEEEEEDNFEDMRCVYCGEALKETDDEQICELCAESIRQGAEEAAGQREAQSADQPDFGKAMLVVCSGLVLFVLFIVGVYILGSLLP